MGMGFDARNYGSEPHEIEQSAAELADVPAKGPLRRGAIAKILSEAVQMWLRSLLTHVDELRVEIDSGARQLFSGHIPGVSLKARGAVYQGLHLTQIQLTGTGIRVNLAQVVRGQPLCILEPIPVVGELLLQQADLNASLEAPLLANALIEFLLPYLFPASAVGAISRSPSSTRLENPQITIDANRLTLKAHLVADADVRIAFVLGAGLQLASGHELQLVDTDLQVSPERPVANLEGFKLDFGPEVDLEKLALNPGQLEISGRIRVIP